MTKKSTSVVKLNGVNLEIDILYEDNENLEKIKRNENYTNINY